MNPLDARFSAGSAQADLPAVVTRTTQPARTTSTRSEDTVQFQQSQTEPSRASQLIAELGDDGVVMVTRAPVLSADFPGIYEHQAGAPGSSTENAPITSGVRSHGSSAISNHSSSREQQETEPQRSFFDYLDEQAAVLLNARPDLAQRFPSLYRALTTRPPAPEPAWTATSIAERIKRDSDLQVSTAEISAVLGPSLAYDRVDPRARILRRLRPDEPIPPETQAAIRTMEIDWQLSINTIQAIVLTPEGQAIPYSRIEAFLEAEAPTPSMPPPYEVVPR